MIREKALSFIQFFLCQDTFQVEKKMGTLTDQGIYIDLIAFPAKESPVVFNIELTIKNQEKSTIQVY